MIVYHGSTEIIKNPDVVHSKKYLDFGRGFYITTFENQAKKWAVRKGMRQEKAAIVNVYELSEEWDDFKVLSFEKENEKWLDFVCACRKGQQLEEIYKQNLENDIINVISEIKGIDLRKAFDIYYSSKLAEQISNDSYGIENMDAKYLAEDLIENEPELFK